MTYLRKQPRQSRSKATFDAIVEAAARILAEQGTARLTTNRIAERAGVAVGSLYQYFPNRAAIVRALLERELARAEARRPALIDDASRLLSERVRAVVDWHLDLHAANPELGRALRRLAQQVLPRAEQERLLAWRAERVLGNFGAPAAADGRAPAQVAFLLDVCLDAATHAVAERRPEWLATESLRVELAALLARYLEPRAAGG